MANEIERDAEERRRAASSPVAMEKEEDLYYDLPGEGGAGAGGADDEPLSFPVVQPPQQLFSFVGEEGWVDESEDDLQSLAGNSDASSGDGGGGAGPTAENLEEAAELGDRMARVDLGVAAASLHRGGETRAAVNRSEPCLLSLFPPAQRRRPGRPRQLREDP